MTDLVTFVGEFDDLLLLVSAVLMVLGVLDALLGWVRNRG